MISLSKGQVVDLSKQAKGLRTVTMGLGWDAAKPKGFLSGLFGGGGAGNIDLDASCLVFDARKGLLETVWFRQLQSRDGLIRHSGDNLTGDGDGDDETISVDLAKLSPDVAALVFTVNSFRGQTFDQVDNASCRLVDQDGKEVCNFALAEKGRHTGVVMATVTRNGAGWSMKAVGLPADGRTVHDLASVAASVI